MPAPSSRRKRPHPASGARRLAGYLSVAAMFGLTGGMAVAGRITSGTSASTRTTAKSVAATSSEDDSTSQRALSTSAVAGSASSQSVTVSHAS